MRQILIFHDPNYRILRKTCLAISLTKFKKIYYHIKYNKIRYLLLQSLGKISHFGFFYFSHLKIFFSSQDHFMNFMSFFILSDFFKVVLEIFVNSPFLVTLKFPDFPCCRKLWKIIKPRVLILESFNLIIEQRKV